MIKNKFLNTIVIATMALSLAMPSCFAQSTSLDVIPKTQSEKQSELSNVAKKFSKSMFLVIGSSIAVYFILLLYKRYRNKSNCNNSQRNISNDLNSPENTDEAIKFIIEKF